MLLSGEKIDIFEKKILYITYNGKQYFIRLKYNIYSDNFIITKHSNRMYYGEHSVYNKKVNVSKKMIQAIITELTNDIKQSNKEIKNNKIKEFLLPLKIYCQ